MIRKNPTFHALLHILAEYCMVFPLLYLISTFMTGVMSTIFLVMILCFALLGFFTRRFIPVPWLQLAIGLPACFLLAIWLGLTFGSRAEPVTYIFPAVLSPLVFYRGKQHAQNDWNAILPTYAPCFIMILNFIVMALVNYLGALTPFAAVLTPAGILSLLFSFFAMNHLNRRNLADNQRAGSRIATAVSKSLSLQNQILLTVLLVLGALLSCMPWLLTAAGYLFQFVSFLVGLLLNLILALVPPLQGSVSEQDSVQNPMVGEINTAWDGFFKVLAGIFFVLVLAVLLILLFLILRKLIKLLRSILHNMLKQDGLIGNGGESFEDTQESTIDFRDLPRKYYDNFKKKFAQLRRGKRWNELQTESERVRYLYRSSLKRAEKSGYHHKTSYTPHEALDEAAQDLPQIQPVREDLAAQYDLVRYAEREPAPGNAERIREQSGL